MGKPTVVMVKYKGVRLATTAVTCCERHAKLAADDVRKAVKEDPEHPRIERIEIIPVKVLTPLGCLMYQ